MIFPLPQFIIDDAVRAALREDLGEAGDLTSAAVVPADARLTAVIAARKPGVVAGLEIACAAFRLVDPALDIRACAHDGACMAPGDAALHVSGSARAILAAERVALNYLCHLSGVATATAALVDAVKGTHARIVCTRKTTPGLRAFEKHAVLAGGGANHRFGLNDAMMIKDNHIAAAGGVVPALKAAKAARGHMVRIEIEVDGLDQLAEVLDEGGADVILLDNMPPADLKKAVAATAGRAVLEASGTITAETVRAVAETGVDVISSGWITHSAPVLDFGLDAA